MIIVIASAKGGSGKTTTAMHLADYLSRRRSLKRVVLLDADPDNESSSFWYQSGENWGFDLVSTNDKVPDFDALVVDAGAAPDSEELEDLMQTANLLVIPTAPTPLDVRSAVATAAQFDTDTGDVKLLLTLVQPGRSKAGPEALAMLQSYDLPICPHMIYRRTCVSQSVIDGVTVSYMKGKAPTKSWKEFQTAFRWLLKGIE